jgi:hypothetical protein
MLHANVLHLGYREAYGIVDRELQSLSCLLEVLQFVDHEDVQRKLRAL